MKPERDIVSVLDRILNKGVLINADVIISVAGIPLIGITLKAALASIETMLDYGMMEAWDKSTREWYAKDSARREAKLLDNENLIMRTFGSVWYSHGIITTWRPGFWHLTDKRLFLWNGEMIFETSLDKMNNFIIEVEPRFNRELNLKMDNEEVKIRVMDASGFRDMVFQSLL